MTREAQETDPPSDIDRPSEEVLSLVAQGAELYNGGAYWEAHEAWEDGWHQLQAAGLAAASDLLQGLILITAGFENLERGKPSGFRVQVAKGLLRLREHPDEATQLGLEDPEGFHDELLQIYLEAQRDRADQLEDLTRPVPPLELRG